jgi:hypothetical protein
MGDKAGDGKLRRIGAVWREGSLRKTVAWTFSDGVRTMEVFGETVSTHERFAICVSFQLFCLHNNERCVQK